jgi:hypothetical protein
MLKKQTLDKNILTGKPQMCMLTIIILCDTFDDAVILNNTNRIMKTSCRTQRLLVFISCVTEKTCCRCLISQPFADLR